jgi:hypothetical protein
MKSIILSIPLLFSLVNSLSAGGLGLDVLTGTAGYAGGLTAGYEFAVTNSAGITVDGLGFWDDQADGFYLSQTFPVGLWDANTGTLLSSTVISSSSALKTSTHTGGDWRLNTVTPVYLPPGLYRLGGLLPDVGANPTIGGDGTIQLGTGINLIRYLRHIDGTTLIMPDLGPPYPEAQFLAATFTYSLGNNISNLFTFSSSPTAWIGSGQTVSFTDVSASRTFNLGAYTDSVHFSAGGYELTLVGPNLTLAQVGYYPGAMRWPFMFADTAGLNLTAPGRGNNTLSGWFNVLQADYQTNGQIAAFAVDFVQYDETITTRWNRGSVRYNSIIPVPGALPPMSLSKMLRTNGLVQFTLAGPADVSCVLQTSSNLVNWVALQTNAISPVGLISVTDSNAAGAARRFYRAAYTVGSAAPTNNDNFANRFTIPSGGGTATATNTTATKESGEPNHGDATGGKSLWWTWTAPASGLVSISLDGSSFDTTLGIYQGTAVNSLVSVAQDDEGGAGSCSRVIFTATAGVTYQIAVDGYFGASGTIKLILKPGLLNDDFADRLQLIGAYDYVVGNSVGAYWEPGEPYHWETTGEKSVWWRWQAPTTGMVTMSTAGSNFDTILAAYTGTAVSSITLVANNDDANTSVVTSQISFMATAGTTYQIAVDGYGTAAGSIILLVQQ